VLPPGSLAVGAPVGGSVGPTVRCSSVCIGEDVVVAAGDDEGTCWSILYSDGCKVTVGSGAEVGNRN
jgi:hypothetical protein